MKNNKNIYITENDIAHLGALQVIFKIHMKQMILHICGPTNGFFYSRR